MGEFLITLFVNFLKIIGVPYFNTMYFTILYFDQCTIKCLIKLQTDVDFLKIFIAFEYLIKKSYRFKEYVQMFKRQYIGKYILLKLKKYIFMKCF